MMFGVRGVSVCISRMPFRVEVLKWLQGAGRTSANRALVVAARARGLTAMFGLAAVP